MVGIISNPLICYNLPTMNGGIKYLSLCLMLAIGELIGTAIVRGADTWPFFAVIALIIALIGYAFNWVVLKYIALVLLGIGIFLFSSIEREHLLREKPWLRNQRSYESAPPAYAKRAQRFLAQRIGIGLEHNPKVRALNRAILLGGRDNLRKDDRKTFISSGTMHVFAISGMHVMVVAGVFEFLFVMFFVPLRWRGLCILPLLWGYVAIIGFPPSAIRAAMMASLYFVAPVFYRKRDAIMAWVWTFIVVHVVNPQMIANIGCQLSFAVTLALIVAGRMAQNVKSAWHKTWIFTLAAWVASAPISAYAFGRVTPGGIIANIMLAAVATYSIVAGVIGVGTSFISETLASHINNFAGLATSGMVVISETVARLPFANFEIGKISAFECILWYILAMLIFYLYYSIHQQRNLI